MLMLLISIIIYFRYNLRDLSVIISAAVIAVHVMFHVITDRLTFHQLSLFGVMPFPPFFHFRRVCGLSFYYLVCK